jgi:nitroimidazol reductase NimA-like FMN-containing flavoprotein (pyridoxamine 5'-phosphate oxidase superfamily)
MNEQRRVAPHTERTRIRRHAERAVPDRIEEILTAGRVAHVACSIDGEPHVVPFLYLYEAGRIVIHGSPASRTLARLRRGGRAAVSVSILDGLVASRDAETHSANYRSVVAYGVGRRVRDGDEKRRLLEETTARYFPGRTAGRDYAAATPQQLATLEVVEIVIEEAAAKSRGGPPLGPRDADEGQPGSAGVFELDGVTLLAP